MKIMGLVLLLGLTAVAEPVKVPPISVLLDSKTVSLGVVQARPEDTGFQSLFNTAWESIKLRNSNSGSALDLVANFLVRSGTNILIQLLPMQMVRVDHFDENNQDLPSFMVTIAGFQGLQSIFYASLLNGPNGKPFETQKIGKETVVIRAKPGQKREEALVLARLDGTFYGFANLETARHMLEKKNTINPELGQHLNLVDQSQDTYGVLLNKHNSVLRFLEWVNRADFAAVKAALGQAMLEQLFQHVTLVAWTGDLISDDRMDMQVRWRTDSPQAAEQLEKALSLARKTLAERGRTGEIRLATVDTEVLMDIQFTGYKKMLQDYLARP